MLGGPGKWFHEEDPFYLRELFGQCKSYAKLSSIAQASKIRVLYNHQNSCRGGETVTGLSCKDMHDRLTRLCELDFECPLARPHNWSAWYDNCHASILCQTQQDLSQIGISLDKALRDLSDNEMPPWGRETKAKVKNSLQSYITKSINAYSPPDGEERIRENLYRCMDWGKGKPSDIISNTYKIPGPIAHVAARVFYNLQRMRELVPPKVGSAVSIAFSTAGLLPAAVSK